MYSIQTAEHHLGKALELINKAHYEWVETDGNGNNVEVYKRKDLMFLAALVIRMRGYLSLACSCTEIMFETSNCELLMKIVNRRKEIAILRRMGIKKKDTWGLLKNHGLVNAIELYFHVDAENLSLRAQRLAEAFVTISDELKLRKNTDDRPPCSP